MPSSVNWHSTLKGLLNRIILDIPCVYHTVINKSRALRKNHLTRIIGIVRVTCNWMKLNQPGQTFMQ